MSGSAERRLEARRVASAAGDVLVIEVVEPVPIGTRVSLDPAQVGLGEPGAEPLRGKVVDVRRSAETFAVTLKLHSVTRAQRDAIANAIRPSVD
ncbi:MAG: hypothetical protein M0R80_29140 [Proteobacteria bacterium]|nr:hypothetical protein [Pseudomonadota bacterium]